MVGYWCTFAAFSGGKLIIPEEDAAVQGKIGSRKNKVSIV